eukprot:gene13980-15438_t
MASSSFSYKMLITCSVLLILDLIANVHSIGEVIFAVNAGGSAHTDLNGVHYQADKLSAGVSSDHGKNIQIARVAPPDQVLYQTERYHVADFGYNIPIKQEGNFVLVLKFSEVYFRGSKLKVFDVRINQFTVVKDLDIYDKVGYGIAHDEYIPFTIKKGTIIVGKQKAPFPGQLHVEFVKTYYDNPKINALAVFTGTVDDIPKLAPLKMPEEKTEEKEEPEEIQEKTEKKRKTSGPKTPNPYELDDSSFLYPILIAIGIFLPTLLCLCKL